MFGKKGGESAGHAIPMEKVDCPRKGIYSQPPQEHIVDGERNDARRHKESSVKRDRGNDDKGHLLSPC